MPPPGGDGPRRDEDILDRVLGVSILICLSEGRFKKEKEIAGISKCRFQSVTVKKVINIFFHPYFFSFVAKKVPAQEERQKRGIRGEDNVGKE